MISVRGILRNTPVERLGWAGRSVTVMAAASVMLPVVSGSALADDGIVTVQLDPDSIVCTNFWGFGAEWDSSGYAAHAVTDTEFAVIRRRVEWMKLPIVRIMMQSTWCYQGDGRYDWENAQMQSLYRHLDVCQELGITVLLTDWGVEPSWLKTPDVNRVEDPQYAEIISTYMDHLLNARGYTCIRYFILVNEPNLEVKDWHRWKTGVHNVAAAFQRKELAGKVSLMGSDQSGGDDWHRNAVDQLNPVLGAYDIHRYASEGDVRTGGLVDYFREHWAYVLAHDPEGHAKPLVVGEAGLFSKGFSAGHNPLHLDFRYGVLMSDYAIQAANAGSWAVLAWMLDDNSHQGFTWGMWKNRDQGLEMKPWFYTWSLLARCFRPGAHIVAATVSSMDVRVLAARRDDTGSPGGQSWAFCIVNRSDGPKTIRLQLTDGPSLILSRYLFSKTSARADPLGFPVAVDRRTYDLGTDADFFCEAESTLILCSDDNAGHSPGKTLGFDPSSPAE